ncbi:MAG: MFS transporter [Flavobacteriaceae bacterium]
MNVSPASQSPGLRGQDWKTPAIFLMAMTAANHISFAGWQALINNFAIGRAGFSGADIGLLQSIREIPGFLAFTAIFVIIFVREQRLALISLFLMGLGVAITGMFPTLTGLLITTFVMSVGFHYFETMQQSLALQWLPKKDAPAIMGKILSVTAVSQLLSYGGVLVASKFLGFEFTALFAICGGVTLALVFFLAVGFPAFPQEYVQHKKIVLRKRYWLYYALTFMAGARRQIFIVFAAFMMVEKFHYSVAGVSALFLINCTINMFLAPAIGRLIGRLGERRALTFEYTGLVIVFVSYALVQNPWIAAGLYVVDHIFFSMALALKTYFQKIGDPQDMAPTAAVAFTISHIVAVFIPVLFGLMWLVNPALVFYAGAAMAGVSLCLALLIPRHPAPGHETVMAPALAAPAE